MELDADVGSLVGKGAASANSLAISIHDGGHTPPAPPAACPQHAQKHAFPKKQGRVPRKRPGGVASASRVSADARDMCIIDGSHAMKVARGRDLSRLRRDRPRRRRAAEQRDELSPPQVGHGSLLPALCQRGTSEGHGAARSVCRGLAPLGRRTVNTDPFPGSLVTVTSPPIMRK
jgi:hypothetical protein